MSTREFGSLVHFAQFCGQMAVQAESHHHALEEAAQHLEHRVRQVLGTYDLSPTWPQLTAATQADRVRKGFTPNDPLFRDGSHIRDTMRHSSTTTDARVGTDSQIAEWMELGTRRAPPRSFLRLSAIEQERELVRILRRGALRRFVTP